MPRSGYVATSLFRLKVAGRNIVFLLDRGAAMRGPAGAGEGARRVARLRRALGQALARLAPRGGDGAPEEDHAPRFALLVFGSTVKAFKPNVLVRATEAFRTEAETWLGDELRPEMGTNLHAGLLAALDLGTSWVVPGKRADTIVVVSAGRPDRGALWSAELLLREVALRNASRMMTIHTLGLGEEHDAVLLRRLARENHGSYVAVGDAPEAGK